ncbi:MAG: ADP-ribosylglycohydrolase family protein [Enterocloster aldenensis]
MKQIYDGMIGLAVGDALGVPVEFKSRREIAGHPVVSMRGYGTHNQPRGTWSDDTSLTLALLDSIGCLGSIRYTDIMDKFSSWLLYGDYTASGEVFDVGNTTSRAIMNYGRGMNPLACGGGCDHENGNGSLMRILPLAYYLCGHKELDINARMRLIHDISSLTHRHRRSLVGCGIYILTAMELIEGTDSLMDCVKRGVCKAFNYYDNIEENEISSYDRIRQLDQFMKLSEHDISGSGYVVHTLEAALWCLLNTYTFEQCVLKAVNLGDDTDTVGAVTGGLAGIYYGASGIPEAWLDVVARRGYIKELCGRMQEKIM